jgi:hypothetical protein
MICLAYETRDLSDAVEGLTESSKNFHREISLRREKAFLRIRFNRLYPDDYSVAVQVEYYRWWEKGSLLASGRTLRSRLAGGRAFRRTYRITEVPAELTRRLLRLGCSDELMRLLQEAYDDMLLEALHIVPHDRLHTDNEDYDL